MTSMLLIDTGISQYVINTLVTCSHVIAIQWRSEGGQGGGICPRAPPGGGRQNPAKDFLKIYIRKNFNNSERKKFKCSNFFF